MKHERLHKLLSLLAVIAWLSMQPIALAFAQAPIVHAVLFYSPSCGHCHYVITEVFPPLFEQYGDQLQIMGVDVTSVAGQALYQAAVARFEIPDDQRGVPNLIIDETVMVGSIQIPEQFPGLIEQYLAAGGVDWPDIPGLAEAIQASEAAAATASDTTEAGADESISVEAVDAAASESDASLPDASDDLLGKLQRDPVGNGLAVAVLAGMIAVIVHAVRQTWRGNARRSNALSFGNGLKGWRSWAVAAFGLLGLGVSIYMAYVETTNTAAVCGPIGDCNTVQQSSYAVLFGLIPIGVLGVLGYAAILIAWSGTQLGRGQLRSLSEAALFGMALFGTLFSIYLTFLEPFVIGATCAWCLTSGVSITLILLVLVGSTSIQPEPARQEARAEAIY